MTYHRDYAGRWFLTLAQGTEESAAGCSRGWPRSGRSAPSCGPTTSAPRSTWCSSRSSRSPASTAPRSAPCRPPAPHRGAQPATGRDAGRGAGPPAGVVVSATARADAVAAAVTDPEMPMLTLEDLGVLRDVVDDGPVVVTITPTYSGCPAMATMRDDLVHRLRTAGYAAGSRSRSSPPGRATGSPSAAARPCARTGSPRPARRRPARPGPADPDADPARADLPAVRLPGRPS